MGAEADPRLRLAQALAHVNHPRLLAATLKDALDQLPRPDLDMCRYSRTPRTLLCADARRFLPAAPFWPAQWVKPVLAHDGLVASLPSRSDRPCRPPFDTLSWVQVLAAHLAVPIRWGHNAGQRAVEAALRQDAALIVGSVADAMGAMQSVMASSLHSEVSHILRGLQTMCSPTCSR